MNLQLVGGGRMGEALLTGLLASGWAEAGELAVVEKLADRRAVLQAQFPGVRVATDPMRAHGAVIAVKPGDVEDACAAVATAGCERVLSIAAGVTLARLQEALGGDIPVVRAMPNTPALVGAGAAAIAAGAAATDDDLGWAESILAAVGIVVRLPEHLLDAVTGLSGSGPAYVFLVAEALVEAGVLVGLPRDVSATLATQTLLGAARLLVETGDPPEALRAMVTSPGGTTAAGLRALESAGVRAAFLDAVSAATERSKELGQS
ncbi:MAG TPA: pyrroline-5-carboxylate reductase [Acidimicrobiales bacterium]|jgi:pyrroline-5-carboxylate reductase|nr:pyrroline-5-carboxylate reductase [Acidimicrobiales bacterium]